jgi:hypothetical protein
MADSEKWHFPSIGHWFSKNWFKSSTFRQVYHSSITAAAVCTDSSYRVTEVSKKIGGGEAKGASWKLCPKNPPLKKPAVFFIPFLQESLSLVPIRVRWIQSTPLYHVSLTLNPLTWKIWWAPNNASKWQMGFNFAFKWLIQFKVTLTFTSTNYYFPCSMPSI